MKPRIKIKVVSDVVCPWCYIGKRRMENALKNLSGEIDFDVHYLPFELNPEMPLSGLDQKAYLVNKFGGDDRYEELTSRVTEVAAQEGITFDYQRQKISPNTRKLHAIIAMARHAGLQSEVVEALYNAYFTDGVNLSDEEDIVNVAVETGLEEGTVRLILNDERKLREVAAVEEEMQKLGITGVPFFIINNKYGISGAQSVEVFERALRDIANEQFVGT